MSIINKIIFNVMKSQSIIIYRNVQHRYLNLRFQCTRGRFSLKISAHRTKSFPHLCSLLNAQHFHNGVTDKLKEGREKKD